MFGKSVSSSHPRAGHSGSCKRVSSAQDESQQQQQSFQASHHLRGSSSAGPSSMARPIPAWPAPCQQAKNGEVEGSCQVSALPESRDHIHRDTHTHTHTHTHMYMRLSDFPSKRDKDRLLRLRAFGFCTLHAWNCDDYGFQYQSRGCLLG